MRIVGKESVNNRIITKNNQISGGELLENLTENKKIGQPQFATVINQQLYDLEQQKKAALDNIDKEYYNRRSPHYGDNERFSWAVKTINEMYHVLKNDLREKNENKTTQASP